MKRTVWVTGLGALLLLSGTGAAGAAEAPTFAKDVAPIVFAKCVSCHRPGEVAPMSLLKYEQVRPWAKAIRQKVVSREMPPWGADPKYGTFANDISLSDAEIQTIVDWVAAGAPRGDDKDLPKPPEVATGWTYGEPDFVISMMAPYQVPPEGEMPNLSFWSPIPFKEDRFARLLEWRPGNRSVVHHGTADARSLPSGGTLNEAGEFVFDDGVKENDIQNGSLQRSERSVQAALASLAAGSNAPRQTSFGVRLTDYVPGRTAMPISDPDVGTRLPAGMYVHWGMHYQPTGRVETDQSRLGIWFTEKTKVQEVFRRQVGDPLPGSQDRTGYFRVEGVDLPHNRRMMREELGWPNIDPGVDNYEVASFTPITEPITLFGFTPHMHLRGKDKAWFVTYPDGRQETLLSLPKYDFNWQYYYELKQPMKIPAGSVLSSVAHYSNASSNKYNPAPDKEVYWSEQSWDEMYCPFIVYTVDSQSLKKGAPPSRSSTSKASPKGQAAGSR